MLNEFFAVECEAELEEKEGDQEEEGDEEEEDEEDAEEEEEEEEEKEATKPLGSMNPVDSKRDTNILLLSGPAGALAFMHRVLQHKTKSAVPFSR